MGSWEPVVFIDFERNNSGTRHSLTQRIHSFEYDDSATETNMLKFTATDHETYLIDHPELLDDGYTVIRFSFGHLGRLSKVHESVLTFLHPKFPESGSIEIEVKAFDKGIWIQAEMKTRVFKQKGGLLASDIATQIALEHNMKPVVEKTKHHKSRWTQGNMTDLEFLKHIAKNQVAADSKKTASYLVYIQDNELHFHPADTSQAPSYEFTYFPDSDGDLLSFEPQIEQKKKNPTAKVGSKTATNANTPSTSLGKSEPGENPDNPSNDGEGAGEEYYIADGVTRKVEKKNG